MSNPGGETRKQASPSANSTAAPASSDQDTSRRTTNSPPRAPFRMLLVSFLSAGIGLVAGVVAFALYKLIGLFTNLFFFHRWSADFSSAHHNQLGWLVIVVPVIGGLIVLGRSGVMAARLRRFQDEHVREPGWFPLKSGINTGN